MNWLILAAVLALAVLTAAEQDKYTDRYDNLNVDEIMGNKRLLGAYIKCLLDNGRCTAEGKEMKEHMQDAMQSGCSKCTEAQKQKARKVVKHIMEHEKESWEKLKVKYDPKDEYKETYEAFLARDD